MGLFGWKVPIERNIHPPRDIRAAWRRNIHDQESMSKPNFQTAPDLTPKPDPNWWHAHALRAYQKGLWGRARWLGRIGQIVDPAHLPSAAIEGHGFFQTAQAKPALAAFGRCLRLRPDHGGSWDMIAVLLHVQGDRAAAAAAAGRFILTAPDDPAAGHKLFHMLRAELRDPEAEKWLRRAYLASRAARTAIETEAERDERAVSIGFDLGMLLLSKYRWDEAWRWYNLRLQRATPKPYLTRYPQPFWTGAADPSAHLLVWGDQNIGDEMQFAQILPELRPKVRRVTLECDARLAPLFQRSFPWLDVVPRGESPPQGPFDLQCPSGHLGGLFRSDARSFATRPLGPWLRPDPDKVARLRERYLHASGGRPVIGVAWKSKNINFQGKNLPLPAWGSVLKTDGAMFLSVQYGDVGADLADVETQLGVRIPRDADIDPMVDLDGFAAQLAALDLVISTSNSTVHQACALGRPVWTMVHVRPDWRWGMRGERSPWFPSLRLYRQVERDNWTPVVQRVAGDLRAWIDARPAARSGSPGSN